MKPRASDGLLLVGRLALFCLVVVGSFGSATTYAGEPYRVDDDRWSGLSYLRQTAEEAKVSLEVIDGDMDLATIGPGDVVMWLFPQRDMDVDALVRFVKDGGFLIVADDRGTSRRLFNAFGVEVSQNGPTHHRTYFKGLEGFPIVKKREGADHFLYFNVSQLVANHPVVLRGGTPVFSFEGDGGSKQHLVVEVNAGRGRFLGIGDPSMFINDMIGRPELHGNKQFAANVMRRNCSESCRVKLLTPRAISSGQYVDRGGPLGGLPHVFDEAATLLNDALTSLSETLTTPPWPAIVVFLLVVMLTVLAITTFQYLPLVKPPTTSVGTASHNVTSPLEQDALGMSSVSADADFNHLAETLLNHAEGLQGAGLTPALGAETPFETDRDKMARRALLRIRSEAASFQSAGEALVVSHDRFLRIYDDVRVIARYATEQRRQKRAIRTDGRKHHASS